MTTIAYSSDHHINSTLGLCPRTVNLDDGGTYRSSRIQTQLLHAWEDYIEQIAKLPKPRVAVFGGDLGELDTKRRSHQIVTANKATIQRMIIQIIEPLLDICDGAIFIRGTLAHVGKSSWLEEAIAQDIDISIPDVGTQSHYHFRGKVDGYRFDFAHHAQMGGLPWTEKHAAIRAGDIMLIRYLVDMKEQPPNVAVRSHNHRYADSGGNFKDHDMFVVCSRCFQGKTEFVHRIGKENTVPHIGGHAFITTKSSIQYKDYPYLVKRGRIWQNVKLP